MRNAFAKEITSIASRRPEVVLLSGDIGNKLFDDFKAKNPGRFYNCGVAEANMVGVAAGMAMAGLRPVTYTINAFMTVRCLEQIRVDVCYHEQPVVIAGVGGGLSYAELGATHHSLEDIAFLRLLPKMTVVCPGDPVEVKLALRAALDHDGPVFLRLGKKGEPVMHASEPVFKIGKSIKMRDGKDVALLANGHLLPAALAAADELSKKGVSARVESFHTVKPLDEACLEECFSTLKAVATIEEHSRLGGFGGAVAEWLSDRKKAPGARLVRVGTPDDFFHEAGPQEHAQRRWGLTPQAIADQVLKALG